MKAWLAVPTALVAALTFTLPACAGGVDFSWDACTPEGGVQNKTFACDTNSGMRTMVGSFVLESAMDNFVGIEALVDISADADSLPAWWQIYGAGKCRAALSVAVAFGSDPNVNCTDPWAGQGVGGIGSYRTYWTNPQVTGGGPATAQVTLVAAVPSTQSMALSPGTEYYGFKLNLNLLRTVGSGSCSGCTTPVCLTLVQVKVVAADNSSQGVSAPLNSSTITWQSAERCPGALTSRNTTWGQIRGVLK